MKMISKFRFCLLLLVNADTRLLSVSGAGSTFKSVCDGTSVQAFQNIKFNSCNAVVYLYVNGARNVQIAKWSMHNCTHNTSILPEYNERVFLDQTGTISIHNINHFDQGRYVVVSQTDTLPTIYEVEISVMVPPTKNCKPKIARFGNTLLASLKPNDCGYPVATLYWKDSDDVSSTNKEKLKLTPGKEAGIYHACIEGPALACVKNIMPQDYCDSITIEGSNSSIKSSESSGMNVYMIISVCLGILFTLVIMVIAIRVLKWRRNNPENKKKEASTELQAFINSENMTGHQELLSADQSNIFNDNKMSAVVMPCNHTVTCASFNIPVTLPQYTE